MDLALILTVLLGVSVIGLVLLFALRRYELKTGRAFLGRFRPRVGAFFYKMLVWVEHILPAQAMRFARTLGHALQWLVLHGAARLLLAAERWLEHLLRSLRGATEVRHLRTSSEASAFLQEVAQHKQKLIKRSARTTREA